MFTVASPSLEQYQQLQERYGSNAVNYPCCQLSIPYSLFINLECSFHSVWTIKFISNLSLQELFQLYNMLNIQDAAINAFTL